MDDEKELRRWAGAFVDSLVGAVRKSLVGCFEESAAMVEDAALRSALEEVIREVAGGNSMSRAFALRPEVFPANFTTIVRYGEIYGEVDVTLRRYAERPEDLLSRCAITP